MSGSADEHRVEKPLAGPAKVFLASAAAGMILLFYLFTILSVATLCVLLTIELGLLLVMARFGAGSIMARAMNEHFAALPIFLRSLWLRKGSEYRIPLKREDTPGLVKILKML